MSIQMFAVGYLPPALADDPTALRAVWADRVVEAGGTPIGEPTWRIATQIPDFEPEFGPMPPVLFVEGQAEFPATYGYTSN